MRELLQVFTAHQWIIIIGVGINAVVGAWFLMRYFRSRFWVEAVTDAATGRVVGGDVMKAGAFLLGSLGFVAILIAKLVYGRDAGGEIVAIDVALLGYSGVLQDIKRRRFTPAAPNFNVSDSKVSIGPNGPAPTAEQTLAGYNDGPGSVTGKGPNQPSSME